MQNKGAFLPGSEKINYSILPSKLHLLIEFTTIFITYIIFLPFV